MPDGPPAWISEAVARGGPGLCASIGDSVVVYRRTDEGRLIEILEFSEKHPNDPEGRHELRYDKAGRLVQELVIGEDGNTVDRTIDLWYDKTNRVVRQRMHHRDASLWGGDVNVTYTWKGKTLPNVPGPTLPPDLIETPTEPLAYALRFSGTVTEAHFYDGSPAPQPESETERTYDARGRLVRVVSTGWGSHIYDDTLEWDDDDQLVTYKAILSTTKYEWRDHHVVTTRDFDRDGKQTRRWDYRFDATGRPIETVRIEPAGTTRERTTSTTVDKDRGELVTTTVQEDVPTSQVLRTYRYDCGPPATPSEAAAPSRSGAGSGR